MSAEAGDPLGQVPPDLDVGAALRGGDDLVLCPGCGRRRQGSDSSSSVTNSVLAIIELPFGPSRAVWRPVHARLLLEALGFGTQAQCGHRVVRDRYCLIVALGLERLAHGRDGAVAVTLLRDRRRRRLGLRQGGRLTGSFSVGGKLHSPLGADPAAAKPSCEMSRQCAAPPRCCDRWPVRSWHCTEHMSTRSRPDRPSPRASRRPAASPASQCPPAARRPGRDPARSGGCAPAPSARSSPRLGPSASGQRGLAFDSDGLGSGDGLGCPPWGPPPQYE